MPIFEIGDIVVVPFPFVEIARLQRRPALVVSTWCITDDTRLLWVLMITTAASGAWIGDISLTDRFGECGLSVPCVIRTAKLSTVEATQAKRIGTLPPDLLDATRAMLRRHLAL